MSSELSDLSEQSKVLMDSADFDDCEVEMARLEGGRASMALLESNQSVSPIQITEEPKRRRLVSQRLSAGGNSLLKKALHQKKQNLPAGRRDPLLSSTMVEATHGDCADWPNASSIHLNSRDSLGLPQRDLSHLLRTEEVTSSLGLEQSSTNNEDSKLKLTTAPSASIDDDEVENVLNRCCIEAVTSPNVDSLPLSSPSCGAAPRKNLLKMDAEKVANAGKDEEAENDDDEAMSSDVDKQSSVSLMQISRLVLSILLDGDLLRDHPRRWLTPEILCDKICASLDARRAQSDSSGGASSAFNCLSSVDNESLDNSTKVRHWLVSVTENVSGGGTATHSV